MKRIRDAFLELSLGKKLVVYLLVFIMIPLGIVAFIIQLKASNVVYDKTRDNLLQVLKQTRFGIENIVREADYLSLTILSDDYLQELIHFHTEKNYLDAERNKAKLFVSFDSLLHSKPYINSIAVSRGREIIFQYGDSVQVEDTRFHGTAEQLGGKVFWTPPYLLNQRYKQTSPKPVISLVRAVNDLNAPRQIAVERVSVDESYLSNMYAGIHSWNGGGISIVDRAGKVVSSPNKDLLDADLSDQEYVRYLLQFEEGYFDARINGADSAVFHYRIEDTGWHVVEIVPKRELLSQLEVVKLFILIGMSLCALFGILFFIVQSKSVVKPLKRLTKEMAKVKSGNLNVHLEIRSKDEIGRVSYIFIDMVGQIQNLIEKVYKGQIREKEAELKALQAQINPHFLYNTLDSIRWMAVKRKAYDIGEQIEALSDLFRHTLNQGRETTTIGREIDHLKNYLLIQQNRFADKLSWDIEVDPTLMEEPVPTLLLQPLVENAIIHGIEPKIGSGTLRVSVFERFAGEIVLRVEDDGVGIGAGLIDEILKVEPEGHKGFALRNIADRLRLRYGSSSKLEVRSEPGQGACVELTIPRHRETGESE
ncbi:sensor histidine kinase [Cohnella sp. LGH]|uniref:sensor histidine kinase n=1 Tax=Cohnella sp. LGH TaxID=1619153 RepID=UPI001ADB2619|nr:sensor histidine kinase [Cohnella sp. LGH]QTH41019.1 sensor histidine kinase [Cohnella sp. LGH]